ncbi:hypothetical protein GUJ93_ZPchr0004g40315 [Zizania palustris]|uniref:F-box domain-containing protein n=1 Tax=Zizania palustris TaxID=103762 RepID=A0A8J5VZ77_ZIZPA|nr:hypothetical protein GUJ93_ZPchr0004g40315 [Zizania palustris]
MQRPPGAGAGMCDLPMDCVARIASMTSPGDVLRLAAAAAALRSAAYSDDVWGNFLPLDWADIVDRRDSDTDTATDDKPPVVAAAAHRERETKKELFFRLCDSPVLLDGGKLSFSLERRSGAKKYLMPAKALCFGWSGYPYGGLVWLQHHPGSRFSEVAVLSHLCWLDIYGIFHMKYLSNDTDYAAYLVYKVRLLHSNNKNGIAEEVGSSSSISNICIHECNHLVPHKHLRSPLWYWEWDALLSPETNSKKTKEVKCGGVCVRSDGWMELEIDKQLTVGKENHEEEAYISIEFRGLTGSHQCQIIVEGIEIRPKK